VNALQKLGAAMIILGIVLPFLGIALPSLATIIYDATPPTLNYPYPSGTSPSGATPLTPGQTITVKIVVVEDGSGISTVKCDIFKYGGSILTTLTLSQGSSALGGYEYTASWTVPNEAGVTYQFNFMAKDNAGNVATKTSYGVTGTPDGYFTINGQQVTATSVIYVNNPTLNIDFTATSLPDLITGIRVIVRDSAGTTLRDFTLTKSSSGNTWSGTHTLSAEGKYTISGYIVIASGSQLQKMELVVQWGGVPETNVNTNVNRFLNILTVFGIALYIVGSLQKRRW